MTAAGIDSMVQKYTLVDTIVDTLEIQEEVPGIMLVAQLKPEAIGLRLLVDQDNISTSVVSESGPDHVQDHHQEDIQEMNAASELQDRVLIIQESGHPLIHSNLTVIIITLEIKH